MNEATDTLTLPVEGMTCGHCTGTVRQAPERVAGVKSVEVDLESKRAKVEVDAGGFDRSKLERAVELAGYRVPKGDHPDPSNLVTIGPIRSSGPVPIQHEANPRPDLSRNEPNPRPDSGRNEPNSKDWNPAIGGMHCASCVARVEGAMKGVPGVEDARVNLATERASIRLDPSRVSERQIAEAVSKAGYSARRAELVVAVPIGSTGDPE